MKKEEINSTKYDIIDARDVALNLIIEKNTWLTKIRWLYTCFVFVFFVAYNSFTSYMYINYRPLILIPLLAILGNLMFIFTLRKNMKLPVKDQNYDTFSSLSSIQLDFDLVVISLLIFYSGGFDSPIIVLFIFYIMVSTFLIYHKKAFKNTLTAIILVVVIFLANHGLAISTKRLTEMFGFTAILLFTFFISAHLARYLRQNEKTLHEFIARTGELSVTDSLTNLYNQAHFFLLLNLQLEKSKRYNQPFSLIILDVDHFKVYNDTNGHILGSEVLKRVAALMKEMFRASDILARYGGDEFMVLLSMSDKVGAYLAADRLREIIEKEPFPNREKQPLKKITLSLGIAAYPEHGTTVNEILDNADKALYEAKRLGRNRALIYETGGDNLRKKVTDGKINRQ